MSVGRRESPLGVWSLLLVVWARASANLPDIVLKVTAGSGMLCVAMAWTKVLAEGGGNASEG